MGFFSRRRKRESAIPDSTGETPLGSFASPEGQPVVGEQVGGGAPDLASMGVADGLAALTQIGPMIQQAIASGNVQISQGEPQVLDMRGSGLREEILEIMGQHGIDPQKGVVDGSADPNSYAAMQQQIMARSPSTASTPAPPARRSTFSPTRCRPARRAARPSSSVAAPRLRQAVLATAELEPVIERHTVELSLGEPYADPVSPTSACATPSSRSATRF